MSRLHIIVAAGSFVSLAGTMLGASLGVFIKKPDKRLLGIITGFAGGLMLSVVVFELIPESIKIWNFGGTIFACIAGMLLIICTERFFNEKGLFNNVHMKVAFMAAIALMLHNLPEGMIMGCGFVAGAGLGIKMALIIAIHDIPEGMAIASPMMASDENIYKILAYALVTAMPTALGTLIGAVAGAFSSNFLGACLAISSGIMLYVVCGEMLPESLRLWEGLLSTLGTMAGIMCGLLLTYLL